MHINCVACDKSFKQTFLKKQKHGNYCTECDYAANDRAILRSRINNIGDAITERRPQAIYYGKWLFEQDYNREPKDEDELIEFLEAHREVLKEEFNLMTASCRFYLQDEDLDKLRYLFQTFDDPVDDYDL